MGLAYRFALLLFPLLLLGFTRPASANQPPVAVDHFYTAIHDQAIQGNLLANDSDPDGDRLTATPSSSPQHGTLDLFGNGGFFYTPASGFVGIDSFTYQVSDGQATSAAMVTIQVKADNNPPTGNSETYTVRHDQTVTGNLLANDSDPDGDPVSIGFVFPSGSYSFLSINSTTGDFTLIPSPGQTGTVTLQYRVTDGVIFSDSATATINFTNDLPASQGQSVNTAEDAPVPIHLAASDADNDPVTVSIVSGPAHGTLSGTAPDVTYTPESAYSGSDSFTFKANDGLADGNTATVSITVASLEPVANPDSFTVLHDHFVSGSVLANDISLTGRPLSVAPFSQPTSGVLALNPDGSFTYTPAAGFVGTDSFTYVTLDGRYVSKPGMVTVQVINASPIANAGPAQTIRTASVTTSVTLDGSGSSDPDGDPITYAWSESGTLLASDARPTITLAPGTHPITLTVTDNAGATGTAAVTITVQANHPPVAQAQTVTTTANTAKAITLAAADADGDPLSYVVMANPAHGTLTGTAAALTYTPAAGYSGSDSFTFKANDGWADGDTATVSITITPVNRAPVANSDTATANAGSPITIAAPGVLANDSDADGDPLTAVLVSSPAHGTLTLNPNGAFTYTPSAGFAGTDSFTYKTGDGKAFSNVATVTITVRSPNQQLQQALQAAISQVNSLISSGALPANVGSMITAALNTALQFVSQSKVQLTTAQLGSIRQGIQAAIVQVNNLVSTGKLPPARGQALLTILQTLLAQLGG